MNYSRKQLEAFGEPFGEACTRKEGGRIIYGGGGSPSTPDKTTQVSDLPDWAKPAAQRMLGKAEALTDMGQNPYQQYQGDRIAQFTPLQKQAYGSASEMSAGPEAFSQQVPGYMSPYIQNVINAEKLEAGRASEILGQQQKAQATQAGAFGGYREAIQRAERERGLRGQMGDIQTKGLQSAYDRAADQFRAGISQGLAVNQNQAMLGGQQQQQTQNVLSQQYQDFQNQQRYPYQQLEFMSNILRGTPMGSVSTMYNPAPSPLAQIAGLGIGAYGMLGRAEGGPVHSYAEGGVTSDQSVESILDRLSDNQLMRAREFAVSQQDAQRVQMIDSELAERASLKRGLGGAFNQLPMEQQDAMTEMAGGGIVAFADNRNQPVDQDMPGSNQDAQYDAARARVSAAQQKLQTYGLQQRRQDPAGFQSAQADLTGARSALEAFERGISGGPVGVMGRTIPAGPAPAPAAAAPVAAPQTRMTAPQPETKTYTRTGGAPAPSDEPTEEVKLSRSERAAAAKVGNAVAQQTGGKGADLGASFQNIFKMLKSSGDEDRYKELVGLVKDMTKLPEYNRNDALAKFGFAMAAAASKPGASVLSSAAEAAPQFIAHREEYDKRAQEAKKLGTQMQIELAKAKMAEERDDRRTAMSAAQKAEELQIQRQRMLQEGSRGRASTGLMAVYEELRRVNPNAPAEDLLNKASRIAGGGFRTDAAQSAKLQAALNKIEEDYKLLPTLKAGSGGSNALVQTMESERVRRINDAYRLYGGDQPAPSVSSGASQVYRFDAKGNPIQ